MSCVVLFLEAQEGASTQILTVSSAMVKTMTPEVIPGAFYFPEAKPVLFSRGEAEGK